MTAHGGHDMGHTVAGWTGSALVAIGSLVLGVAFAAGSPAGLWLGVAIVASAALASWWLHLAGWGKPSGPRPVDRRDWRLRDTDARDGHPDCLGCRLAGRRPQAPETGARAPRAETTQLSKAS
ncbi:HGxxPAAW family protein [Kitasatospora sp. GAS1066B]|uniref:HGxxPAAW family protein n=1 Tax=Kitasatospora sp. GAS1066B TaxID=3156271 RepID=UPI0035156543